MRGKRRIPPKYTSFLFYSDFTSLFLLLLQPTFWRGDRVADCARLESVCTREGTAGSNPALSAESYKSIKDFKKTNPTISTYCRVFYIFLFRIAALKCLKATKKGYDLSYKVSALSMNGTHTIILF